MFKKTLLTFLLIGGIIGLARPSVFGKDPQITPLKGKGGNYLGQALEIGSATTSIGRDGGDAGQAIEAHGITIYQDKIGSYLGISPSR